MSKTMSSRTDVNRVSGVAVITTKSTSGPPPFVIYKSFDLGEYSDAQFKADLKKASKRIDQLESEARADRREGRTRKFPE